MLSSLVPDIETLKARIMDAVVTVTKEMLENTWKETDVLGETQKSTCRVHE